MVIIPISGLIQISAVDRSMARVHKVQAPGM